ncbi:MAG: alpha/beta hydrolase [Ferruginibacter sp.]
MLKYLISLFFVFNITQISAQDIPVNGIEIIYGRKDGMALTCFVQMPAKSNGKALISIVSGNWRSGLDMMLRYGNKDKAYVDRGYTVFNVIHSSQPRYTIPDEEEDIKRAVRFIRYNAKQYGIDPGKIGITGASSGGNLALLIATADDNADINSADPVDRVSSRVQAVAVFFPPTDFLNYGQNGFNASASQAILIATGLSAAFDFKKWNDTSRTYVSISDIETRKNIAKQVSPIYFVTTDDPPTLIIHGDADRLVPLQQSESIILKFQEAKVPNKLIIKKGAGHGWRTTDEDEKNLVEWFDSYLK